MLLGKTVFRIRQKGVPPPAFAYQHTAIAPLPCPNLQLVSYKS